MKSFRLIAITLGLAALGILVLTEACSPMKAKTLAESGSIDTGSSKDICAAQFNPASKAIAKAQNQVDETVVTLFEQHKVHLNRGDMAAKATSSLLNQKILVVIHTDCSSNDPSSLSAKALAQAGSLDFSIKRLPIAYTVNEDITESQLAEAADADVCVAGVTYDGEIRTAALALPAANDPQIGYQNQLSFSNYLYAYNYLTKNQTGPKVKVGVLDTGAACSHTDLTGNLVANCGYNVITPGTFPTDNDGHGSHTAGLIGARTNNSLGIMGISGNNVEIHAIKVIDVNSGTVQQSYTGIQYAIQNNLSVLNISLQALGSLPLIEQGIQEAVQAGIVVVIAAGNQSGNLMGGVTVSPALVGRNLGGAITVGSVDVNSGNLSGFSNYGPYVEIAAPGAIDSNQVGTLGGLYSTYYNGGYSRMMGTSQAAPVIAGAAAILIQFFKAKNKSYTPAQIEALIMQSTDTTSINVSGGRVINFSKLARSAYDFAGIPLCN